VIICEDPKEKKKTPHVWFVVEFEDDTRLTLLLTMGRKKEGDGKTLLKEGQWCVGRVLNPTKPNLPPLPPPPPSLPPLPSPNIDSKVQPRKRARGGEGGPGSSGGEVSFQFEGHGRRTTTNYACGVVRRGYCGWSSCENFHGNKQSSKQGDLPVECTKCGNKKGNPQGFCSDEHWLEHHQDLQVARQSSRGQLCYHPQKSEAEQQHEKNRSRMYWQGRGGNELASPEADGGLPT
jgi:hypothetical protein